MLCPGPCLLLLGISQHRSCCLSGKGLILLASEVSCAHHPHLVLLEMARCHGPLVPTPLLRKTAALNPPSPYIHSSMARYIWCCWSSWSASGNDGDGSSSGFLHQWRICPWAAPRGDTGGKCTLFPRGCNCGWAIRRDGNGAEGPGECCSPSITRLGGRN